MGGTLGVPPRDPGLRKNLFGQLINAKLFAYRSLKISCTEMLALVIFIASDVGCNNSQRRCACVKVSVLSLVNLKNILKSTKKQPIIENLKNL